MKSMIHWDLRDTGILGLGLGFDVWLRISYFTSNISSDKLFSYVSNLDFCVLCAPERRKWSLMGYVESNSENLTFFGSQQMSTKCCLNLAVDQLDTPDTLCDTFRNFINNFQEISIFHALFAHFQTLLSEITQYVDLEVNKCWLKYRDLPSMIQIVFSHMYGRWNAPHVAEMQREV